MTIKQELIGNVGAENVFEDAERLQPHAKDHSLCAPSMPSYVVQPKNAKEVERLIRMANENEVPVVPSSSGIHFNGNTIPKQAAVVLDLRRVNRILAVEERNRMVRVEPGVTWEQLQPELEKHDLMALNPNEPKN